MPVSISLRHVLYVVAATACWGSGTVLSKQVLDRGVAPLTLLVIELAASSLFLTGCLLAVGARWSWSPAAARLTALGVLNPGLSYVLGLLGLVTVSASLAVLVWATEPVVIVLIGAVWLRERIPLGTAAAVGAALGGVLLVVYQAGASGDLRGILLTASAVTACAVYTAGTRRLLLEDTSLAVVLYQQLAAWVFATLLTTAAAATSLTRIGLPPDALTWLLAAASVPPRDGAHPVVHSDVVIPTTPHRSRRVPVVVIGAGQAGLAVGFYLRRAGLRPGEDFLILDAATEPGGAWPRMWQGLRLFSPASFSSLPGQMMPAWDDSTLGYPPRAHVVEYLTGYEQRYDLRVLRPHRVHSVTRPDISPSGSLLVQTDAGRVEAGAVVSTTGTWDRPFWPTYPGTRVFPGRQLHVSGYDAPQEFAGQRVAIVGGGNSAAQILAEVSTVAETLWVTARPPRFLPDDVDGRVLFATARARIQALAEGREHEGVAGLGDIVVVGPVREARNRGVLRARPMFARLTPTGVAWADGATAPADAIIWCTGFRPALRHLRQLRLRDRGGRIALDGVPGTRAVREPRCYLVGYGDWTGPASATLAGVGPSAKLTATAIVASL